MNTRPATEEAKRRERAAIAVTNVAALIRHCDGLWRDQCDREDGWKIDYAVDVDVVKLYTDPEGNADYAHVFDDDSAQDSRATLAELLGNYILLGDGSAGGDEHMASHDGAAGAPERLLVISPHDEELARVRLGIARDLQLQEEQGAATLPAIVQALVTADGQGHGARSLADLVEQLARDHHSLIEAIDGRSGAARQLNRLLALPRGRLQHVSRLGDYSGIDATGRPNPLEPSLLPPLKSGSSEDRLKFYRRVAFWNDRLATHRRQGKQKPYARRDDAIVLASIEWINERAAPRRRRVVLVTGSLNVFAAGESVLLRPGRPETFASEYLRDPRAFLGAKHFFSVRPKSEHKPLSSDSHPLRLLEWLNLFFPEQGARDDPPAAEDLLSLVPTRDLRYSFNLRPMTRIYAPDDPLVAGIVDGAMKRPSSSDNKWFPDSLLGDWIDIGESTVALRKISAAPHWRERAQSLVDEINKRLQTGYSVEAVCEELLRRIRTSLEALYFSTSEVTVMQLLADGETLRGVPALRFEPDRYPQAQRHHEELCSRLWHGDPTFDLEAMYRELSEPDPQNYHAHLIHALAYAARGHWFATRTLCRLAMSIVEAIPEQEREERRGREAAYLWAVAERRLARNLGDLDVAGQRLALAQERETPGLPRDVRFDSEAYALEVARLQFMHFANGPWPAEPDLGRDADRVEAMLSRLCDDDPYTVRKWVHRQAVTNLCVLALLCESRRRVAPALRQRLAALLAGFRREGLSPDAESVVHERDRPFHDAVSDFVYSVALVVFGEPGALREQARARLPRESESLGRPKLPFEAERARAFMKLAGVPMREAGETAEGAKARTHPGPRP